MHCHHSVIRIDPQFVAVDQQNLNVLMRSRQVVAIKTALVPAEPPYWSVLVFTEEARQPAAPAPAPPAPPADLAELTEEALTPAQRQVYEQLRAWRTRRAEAEGLPQYVVAHNKTLLHIAQQHAQIAGVDDLLLIHQFRSRKARKYGAEILQIIAEARKGRGDDLFEEE